MAALDIFSNGLNVISTGQRAGKRSVVFPTNRTLTGVIKLLERKKYLRGYEQLDDFDPKSLKKSLLGEVQLSSQLKKAGAKAEGGAAKKGAGKKNFLLVHLKYSYAGTPAIQELKLHSKPSCRFYYKSEEIPRMKNGYATAIVSTSKGLMTGREAREQKVGGELLCNVF